MEKSLWPDVELMTAERYIMLNQLRGTVTNTHTDHGSYKKHAYTRNIVNADLKASPTEENT